MTERFALLWCLVHVLVLVSSSVLLNQSCGLVDCSVKNLWCLWSCHCAGEVMFENKKSSKFAAPKQTWRKEKEFKTYLNKFSIVCLYMCCMSYLTPLLSLLCWYFETHEKYYEINFTKYFYQQLSIHSWHVSSTSFLRNKLLYHIYVQNVWQRT